ncbi:MAG: hypothetical protein SCALA702_30260 [Melioribacteraceae bacterium]|nr:MAG: hypothetical protein SCALA702_30260 [Melioribacteraceae bacterium]
MFRPVSNGNEFLELYNHGDETINLQNFTFIYQTSNSDGFIETGDGFLLLPGQMAVVFEGDYDLQDGIYADIVPESALVLQIDDNSFGTNGMANSSDRTIYLVDGVGDTVSVYAYTADNEAGYSDEKIIPEGENNTENWQNSLVENGTPGFKNSVSLYQFDLSLDTFLLPASVSEINTLIDLSVKIRNNGLSSAPNYRIDVLIADLTDTLFTSPTTLFSQQFFQLLPGDSIMPQVTITIPDTGFYFVKGVVEFEEDELPVNNSFVTSLYVYDPEVLQNTIIINEIKYDPLDGEPEWIELKNISQESINLKGWRIQDKVGYAIISPTDYLLNADDYLVLSDGEAINDFYVMGIENLIVLNLPSLNNTGDNLKITNPYGVIIDSVNYLSDWGGVDGRSLERRDPANPSQDSLNWRTCEILLSASPGFLNSVTPVDYDCKMAGFAPEKPYYGWNQQVLLKISPHNRGRFEIIAVKLKLYRDFNKDGVGNDDELMWYTILPNGIAPGETFTYPFTTSVNGVGEYHYIAVAEHYEDTYPYNDTLKTIVRVHDLSLGFGDIVINEIMYAPQGQPEWIELYNPGDKTVNINKFYFTDLSDTVLIDVDEFKLYPDSYAVFAEESLNEFYKNEFETKITQLPSLNNSGDWIYLRDSLFRAIDYIKYDPDMGGTNNKSLERIIPGNHQFSEDNYSESTSPERATPASINSVSPKEFDLAITNYYLNQTYYARNDKPEISFTLKNLGNRVISSAEIVYSKDGAVEESFNLSNLNPGDSLILNHQYGRILTGENLLKAYLISNEDEYNWNDTVSLSIIPVIVNEMPGDLVINEIMHSPGGEMPEWVELYNRSDKEINLRGYRLGDEKDFVNLGIEDFILPPENYYLLASDSLIFDYFSIVGGINIKKLPTLNNNGDKVFLQDSLGRIIDSVDYNGYAYQYGRSIERVTSQIIYADSANWQICRNIYGGTPNKINSVSVKAYDLEVTDIVAMPEFPTSGRMFDVKITVTNNGTVAMPVKLDFYRDGLGTLQHNYGDLQSGESFSKTIYNAAKMTDGTVLLEARLTNDFDQYTFNDTLRKTVSSGIEKNALVINEFFPFSDDYRHEWIELYNNSDKTINLKKVRIVDAAGNSLAIEEEYLLQADSFVVVCDDTLLTTKYPKYNFEQIYQKPPAINNDGDVLYLIDSVGVVLDSVLYDGSLGGYIGIERISADKTGFDITNWGRNQNGTLGSPGYINSVTPKNFDYAITGIGFTPPKLRLNEIFDVYIRVENRGDKSYSTPINCKITIDGEIRNVNINNLPSPGENKTFVVAEDQVLLNEIYVYAEISDDDDIYNNQRSGYISPGADERSVLITEFYPNPEDGESEWIELYNPGKESISLDYWRLKDSKSTSYVTPLNNGNNLTIKPEEYIVLAVDTTAFRATYGFEALQLNSITLNNNEDAIKLYDNIGLIIDSVEYIGSRKGYSYERLYFDDDRLIISADKNGATPGRLNSANTYIPVDWNDIVINEIMYEPGIERPEFIELYSEKNINLTGFTIEVNSSVTLLLNNNYSFNPDGYFLISTDSSFINSGVVAPENCSVTGLYLLNSGGSVKLQGLFGEVIDSLTYSPEWHNNFIPNTKNISLEKINPELTNSASTWSSSVDLTGATPGEKNSLFALKKEGFIGIKLEPNPFSPDNDGFEDITYIKYSLHSTAPIIKVRIFDDHGRLVRTLLDQQALPQTGNIFFDGRDDAGTPLRTGMYIVLLEAHDSNSSRKETYKKVVVSARKF